MLVGDFELRTRGCDVVGVEPDKRMAAIAIRRGIPVDVTTFEAWAASDRIFDLVCSAQAWHWINATAGLERAAAVLRPGGRFAAFWYGHRHEPQVAAAARMARGLPPAPTPAVPDPATPTRHALAARPDLFDEVATRRGTTTMTYSADQWMEVEASMGTNRALPHHERERFFPALHAAIQQLEPIAVHWDRRW